MSAATAKTITNEDLMDVMHDLMQMSSDGFMRLDRRMDGLEHRMDGLERRIDGIETKLDKLEADLQDVKRKLADHDLQLAELKVIVQRLDEKHAAYINDIADILDRLVKLERRPVPATKAELKEVQDQLRVVVEWALRAASVVKTPLKVPK